MGYPQKKIITLLKQQLKIILIYLVYHQKKTLMLLKIKVRQLFQQNQIYLEIPQLINQQQQQQQKLIIFLEIQILILILILKQIICLETLIQQKRLKLITYLVLRINNKIEILIYLETPKPKLINKKIKI